MLLKLLKKYKSIIIIAGLMLMETNEFYSSANPLSMAKMHEQAYSLDTNYSSCLTGKSYLMFRDFCDLTSLKASILRDIMRNGLFKKKNLQNKRTVNTLICPNGCNVFYRYIRESYEEEYKRELAWTFFSYAFFENLGYIFDVERIHPAMLICDAVKLSNAIFNPKNADVLEDFATDADLSIIQSTAANNMGGLILNFFDKCRINSSTSAKDVGNILLNNIDKPGFFQDGCYQIIDKEIGKSELDRVNILFVKIVLMLEMFSSNKSHSQKYATLVQKLPLREADAEIRNCCLGKMPYIMSKDFVPNLQKLNKEISPYVQTGPNSLKEDVIIPHLVFKEDSKDMG